MDLLLVWDVDETD